MLRVFIGYDHRQPVSYNVLQHSIISQSSKPVAVTPLVLRQLPLRRTGLTPFTFSRFLVPYLCEYRGWALFLDLDMVVKDDIAKLFDFANNNFAVMVSKNKLKFEWASVMLFNCDKCRILDPQFVEYANNLHQISWVSDELIGELPGHWNHLVGYDKPKNDVSLVHYTQGVPAFDITSDSEHAELWLEHHKKMNSVTSWEELMGPSVHAATLADGTRVPRYRVEPPA